VTFTFDPEEHAYLLGGVPIPSVTQILRYHGHYPPYPAGPYRTRGRNVHAATWAYDDPDNFDVESIGSTIAPYLDSYKLGTAGAGFRWIAFEQSLYHSTLCYAGTPDRRGWRGDAPCILDIKSGDGPEANLQTAGYVCMALSCPLISDGWLKQAKRIGQYGVERYKIRLFSDGSKGKITEYDDPLDIDAWVGYVNCMRHETKGKRGT
jgi:hypothetical protein